MRSGTVAFLAGVLLLLHLPVRPDAVLVQFLPLCLVLAAARPDLRPAALLGAGFLWAMLRADVVLSDRLAPSAAGRDMVLDGVVATFPVRDDRRTRFEFQVSGRASPGPERPPSRLALAWYGAVPALAPGERWRLKVRLRPPRGLSNPGGFDYEAWLFRRGVGARGYVRAWSGNRRIAPGPTFLPAHWRVRLSAAVDAALADHPFRGVVKALVIGVRGDVRPGQWQVLRETGTAHLMAISGLHVGLVAGLAFGVVRRIWVLPGREVPGPSPTVAAAVAALGAATLYAALAGFSVPTRRALVMTAVLTLALGSRRNVELGTALAWALVAVLVLDPLAAISPGFWLSFGAVTVILLALSGRGRARPAWRAWGRVQVAVAVGLLPLTVLFFHTAPLVGPLANLLAVPWTGFVVVPLILAGALLTPVLPSVAALLFQAAAWSLECLWIPLEALAGLGFSYTVPVAPGPVWVVAACIGAGMLLLPAGVPGRWLGLIWLAPALMGTPERPVHGGFTLTVLDVGQGLAVVVGTRRRVLVYDAGPRHGSFDAGRSVVARFLGAAGYRAVDAVVLSHGDADHAGGLDGLQEAFPITRTLVGGAAAKPGQASCRAGMRWAWDGVTFTVLHPARSDTGSGNTASCVLRVEGQGGSALLPGDVDEAAEARLLRRPGVVLRSDLVVAPHHGSRTSSSSAFVAAVGARYVVYATGYRNRFGFPHPEVVARYRDAGARAFDTGLDGAVTVTVEADGGMPEPAGWRARTSALWRAPASRDGAQAPR